jgi:carboxylesterase type B
VWINSIQQIKSYDDVQSIFEEAYASKPTATTILQTYNLTPASSLQDLHLNLIQFMTDAVFGHPTHNAQRSLNSSHNLPDEHPSKVQSYRIEYTNPFPGPLQKLAHHCVDMLYIFDNFHEHLAKIEATNQELVEAMQRHWIDFIWDGCKDETSRCGVKEDEVTVYGRDKKAVVRSVKKDAECVERERRFELLAKDPKGLRRAREILGGLAPKPEEK